MSCAGPALTHYLRTHCLFIPATSRFFFMPSKPATAKGQRWPLSINSRVTRYLDQRRNEQRLTIQCGINGCLFEFAGRYIDVIQQRNQHRKTEHPDWTAPRWKR